MKVNNNLISIVIPTYNRAELISETLDSVLAQTYQNWECIIVDDGSSDNTDDVVVEYIKKDKRFKYYHRPDEHLPGGNGARNYGFEICHGKYVSWLDSDDLLTAKYLERHIKNLANNKADVSICDMRLFLNNANETKKWLSDDWKDSDYKRFCEGYIMFRYGLGIPCFIWRKKLLNGKKLFDETLKRSQEYEFFCRILLQKKPEISKCSEVLVFYRQHQGNKSKEVDSGDHGKIISGIIAKKMVITYLKNTTGISPILKQHFIADALTYLKYKTPNIKKPINDVLSEMEVKQIKRLKKNYKIITKYNGFIKIENKDILILQKKIPVFLLFIKYYVYKKIKKNIKKVILKFKTLFKT